jgi:hypothetical protein
MMGVQYEANEEDLELLHKIKESGKLLCELDANM